MGCGVSKSSKASGPNAPHMQQVKADNHATASGNNTSTSQKALHTVVNAISSAVNPKTISNDPESQSLIPKDPKQPSSLYPTASASHLPVPAIVALDATGKSISQELLVYQGGDEGSTYHPNAPNPADPTDWVLLPPGQLPDGVKQEDVKYDLHPEDKPIAVDDRPEHATRPVLRSASTKDVEE